MLLTVHEMLLRDRRAEIEAADAPAVAVPRQFAAVAPRKVAEKLRLFDVGAEKLTARELAERAGVDIETMRWRLKSRTAEQALALGPADRTRRSQAAKLWSLGDEQLTVPQMAERAGCQVSSMYARLKTYSPAEAVAMGPSQTLKDRAKAKAAATPPAPAPFSPSVFDVKPPPAPAVATSPRVTLPPPPKPEKPRTPSAAPKPAPMGRVPSLAPLARDQPTITPDDVKRTVAQPLRSRYDVDQVPSTFGRIGQVEDTGSAVSRAYGGGA
jgi:hypothetical protein